MDAFVGTWRNTKITNGSLEAILDAYSATDEQREQYSDRNYEAVIAKGDTDKMLTVTLKDLRTSKVVNIKPVLDQHTEHMDLDGKTKKVLTTLEGKNLREKYFNDDGEFINIRSINASGKMITVTSYKDKSFTYEWE